MSRHRVDTLILQELREALLHAGLGWAQHSPLNCSLLRSTHMAWAQCLQVDQLALSHPSCDLCKWAAPSTFGKWIISPIASTSPEYKHSKERTQLLMRQNKLFCHGRVHKEGRQEAAPPTPNTQLSVTNVARQQAQVHHRMGHRGAWEESSLTWERIEVMLPPMWWVHCMQWPTRPCS